jgi:hypothetical protein
MSASTNPASAPVYTPRPIKSARRARRSRAQIAAIEDAIVEQLEREQPATVRHVFYLVANNTKLIDKTEAEYKGTICRLVADLRRSGRIPWGWVADHTRWMRKPRTFTGVASALRRTAQAYRRSMWDDQPQYAEVWCEKDAVSGVVLDVTDPFDVPLMVCRGYPSLTFLQGAAEHIAAVDKPTTIYYLGDHDPSGQDISRHVEKSLRSFAPEAEIHFERLAVTADQIHSLNLPTRPTKTTDSRSKGFAGDSVDVDAIAPSTLRKLVEDAIVLRIDPHRWNALQAIEREEREYMVRLANAGLEGGVR